MGDAVKAMCAAAVEMLDTDDTEFDDWIGARPTRAIYFERQLLDVFRKPWEPSLTELLIAPHRKVERATHQPAQRAKAPGPNDPCFCGSGRKYKKCCRL